MCMRHIRMHNYEKRTYLFRFELKISTLEPTSRTSSALRRVDDPLSASSPTFNLSQPEVRKDSFFPSTPFFVPCAAEDTSAIADRHSPSLGFVVVVVVVVVSIPLFLFFFPCGVGSGSDACLGRLLLGRSFLLVKGSRQGSSLAPEGTSVMAMACERGRESQRAKNEANK